MENLCIADVNAAFLKGMSFEEMAKILGETNRVEHLNPPKGSLTFLSTYPIMKGCGEATHVLGLCKGVYGLKDAPRAWRIKLDQILRGLGSNPMKSDPCLYMWHEKSGELLACIHTCGRF